MRPGRRLVRRGYLVVLCLSFAVGIVYSASGLSSHVLIGGWGVGTLAVPVLAVFAQDDSLLTAPRLAPWVAVENISAAVGRLGPLPLLPVLAMPWMRRGELGGAR